MATISAPGINRSGSRSAKVWTPVRATGQAFGVYARQVSSAARHVSGVVDKNGVPLSGVLVRAFDAATGAFLSSTLTGADGSYTLDCLGRATVFVTGHYPSFDARIHDRIATIA